VRLRVLFASTIVTAALFHAAPARADDPNARSNQNKAKQAQVKGQLDLAKASDAAVEGRLNALNAEVATSQNHLDDARRTQSTATAQVDEATRRLGEATAHFDQTRRNLQAAALRAYMHPPQPTASSALFDVNEFARAEALLSVAAGNQSDAIDASRLAQRDRTQAKSVVQAALATAATRTKVASQRAAELSAAQSAQQRAHDDLQKRIADLTTESAALAKEQGSIEALIATRAGAQPAGSFAAGPVSGSGLIWPVHGPVTSEFGPRWGGFHPGIDIAPPFGTPIHAAKAGVVILAGWVSGYGNYTLIDHGGLVTGYGHQSRLAVTQGQTVTQGQVIGYEGSTGNSTGPHVHFEVRINGQVQNPRNYLTGNP
jgi:murein DD-endopeptidase MepM/ murein hydrolase activator NlpD